MKKILIFDLLNLAFRAAAIAVFVLIFYLLVLIFYKDTSGYGGLAIGYLFILSIPFVYTISTVIIDFKQIKRFYKSSNSKDWVSNSVLMLLIDFVVLLILSINPQFAFVTLYISIIYLLIRFVEISIINYYCFRKYIKISEILLTEPIQDISSNFNNNENSSKKVSKNIIAFIFVVVILISCFLSTVLSFGKEGILNDITHGIPIEQYPFLSWAIPSASEYMKSSGKTYKYPFTGSSTSYSFRSQDFGEYLSTKFTLNYSSKYSPLFNLEFSPYDPKFFNRLEFRLNIENHDENINKDLFDGIEKNIIDRKSSVEQQHQNIISGVYKDREYDPFEPNYEYTKNTLDEAIKLFENSRINNPNNFEIPPRVIDLLHLKGMVEITTKDLKFVEFLDKCSFDLSKEVYKSDSKIQLVNSYLPRGEFSTDDITISSKANNIKLQDLIDKGICSIDTESKNDFKSSLSELWYNVEITRSFNSKSGKLNYIYLVVNPMDNKNYYDFRLSPSNSFDVRSDGFN